METHDETTKIDRGRRWLLRTGALAGGLLAMGSASASPRQDDDEGQVSADADFLFVQSAASAKLADGKLILKGVAPTTIYFSDRPERLAGHVETEHFMEAMVEDEEPNSFRENPPNAALSILDGDFVDEIVVTLLEPEIDGTTIVYPVKVLDGMQDLEGGPATLFIDPIGRPLSPTSVAGVHRRHRRRRRRRAVRRW